MDDLPITFVPRYMTATNTEPSANTKGTLAEDVELVARNLVADVSSIARDTQLILDKRRADAGAVPQVDLRTQRGVLIWYHSWL